MDFEKMRMEHIKETLTASKEIYFRRVRGETGIWSATTFCRECEAAWMWGIENNLVFTCPDCLYQKSLIKSPYI